MQGSPYSILPNAERTHTGSHSKLIIIYIYIYTTKISYAQQNLEAGQLEHYSYYFRTVQFTKGVSTTTGFLGPGGKEQSQL